MHLDFCWIKNFELVNSPDEDHAKAHACRSTKTFNLAVCDMLAHIVRFLTIDDVKTKGKTVFLRVDMNCPIDPKTMEISGKKRIEESIPTIESLTDSKLVIASHQGRVGNTDYTSMAKHAAVLEEMLGRKIRYVEDTIGEAAQSAIRDLKDGEILMLDNLRLCAEENYEFLPEDAAKTIMVSRLWKLFDLCVLDSFPSAHRSHPSIVGFPNVIPACAGRIVEKEVLVN